MNQPFRTVGELPLVEVPRKKRFDWAILIAIGIVLVFVLFVSAVVHDGIVSDKKAERLNKEAADRNAQMVEHYKEDTIKHNALMRQCNDWGSMDRGSCVTCLEQSSIENDKRCATVSRWYMKDSK